MTARLTPAVLAGLRERASEAPTWTVVALVDEVEALRREVEIRTLNAIGFKNERDRITVCVEDELDRGDIPAVARKRLRAALAPAETTGADR